jgi:transcriptional regulator with XRE-family HTH domain
MPPTIAENLRRVMGATGVDAIELSRRLGYPNRATVDHWLAGRRKISRVNLVRVAGALEVEPRELDPNGEAYKPSMRKERSAEKKTTDRSLQKSHTPPHLLPAAAPPLNTTTGNAMGPGDQGLAVLQSVWGYLTPEQRDKFVADALELAHKATASSTAESARKKAAR